MTLSEAATLLRDAGWTVIPPSRRPVNRYASLERDLCRPIAVSRGWHGGQPLTDFLTPEEVAKIQKTAASRRVELMCRDLAREAESVG